MKHQEDEKTLQIIKKCAEALADKKAEQLRILDVRGKSPITNFFVLATANSEPHMKALCAEADKVLKENSITAVGRDFTAGSGWMVIDAFDFMLHVFTAQQRDAYRLDALWKDADEIKF